MKKAALFVVFLAACSGKKPEEKVAPPDKIEPGSQLAPATPAPAPAPKPVEAALPASSQQLAFIGYGLEIVPAANQSAAKLAEGNLVFGPRADRPLPKVLKNVAVKPGKAPTAALTAHPGPIVVFSDGGTDTTSIALGKNMKTWDGVLSSVTLSTYTGNWAIVTAGKSQLWTDDVRVDVDADGKTATLVDMKTPAGTGSGSAAGSGAMPAEKPSVVQPPAAKAAAPTAKTPAEKTAETPETAPKATPVVEPAPATGSAAP